MCAIVQVCVIHVTDTLVMHQQLLELHFHQTVMAFHTYLAATQQWLLAMGYIHTLGVYPTIQASVD